MFLFRRTVSAGHGPKSGAREDSTILIDATLRRDMPPLALPKREYMEHARVIWDELGLPALSPQSPWHGYSLGDWDERFDLYAKRAVEGQWAESGSETIKRRRAGIIPETPSSQRRRARKENARVITAHASI